MSETDAELLDPTKSPRALAKKARGRVRRLNNMPLFLTGAVLLVFVLSFAKLVKDRADLQNATAAVEADKVTSSSGAAAEVLTGIGPLILPEAVKEPDRPVEVPAAPVPAPVQAAKPAEAPSVPVYRLDVPPPPPRGAAQLTPPVVDEDARRKNGARTQSLEAALKARTGVQMSDSRARPSFPINGSVAGGNPSVPNGGASADPLAAYKARIAQIRAAGLAGGGQPSAPTLPGIDGVGAGRW